MSCTCEYGQILIPSHSGQGITGRWPGACYQQLYQLPKQSAEDYGSLRTHGIHMSSTCWTSKLWSNCADKNSDHRMLIMRSLGHPALWNLCPIGYAPSNNSTFLPNIYAANRRRNRRQEWSADQRNSPVQPDSCVMAV